MTTQAMDLERMLDHLATRCLPELEAPPLLEVLDQLDVLKWFRFMLDIDGDPLDF